MTMVFPTIVVIPLIIYLRGVISLRFSIYRPCMCHLSRVTVIVLFLNTEYSGVIYANLKDNTIEDGTPFIQTDTLDSAVDYMVSSSTAMIVGFWMLWIVFIGAAVYGFCYLDNRWLEDE